MLSGADRAHARRKELRSRLPRPAGLSSLSTSLARRVERALRSSSTGSPCRTSKSLLESLLTRPNAGRSYRTVMNDRRNDL